VFLGATGVIVDCMVGVGAGSVIPLIPSLKPLRPSPIPLPVPAAAWLQTAETQLRPKQASALAEIDRHIILRRARESQHAFSTVIVAQSRVPRAETFVTQHCTRVRKPADKINFRSPPQVCSPFREKGDNQLNGLHSTKNTAHQRCGRGGALRRRWFTPPLPISPPCV